MYVGFGNACAGAPCTPAKTWFQTAFVHPSRLLFRTKYCCCEPLMTVLPVKSESEMNPPLANDGPSQKSNRVVSPLTCTRRTGAAWEVAQNSAAPSQPLPATLIDRFDTDRQKFVSAVQKLVASHWSKESTAPLIVTSSGELPRPATSV